MDTETRYELKQGFSYATSQGQQADATHLIMQEPGNEVLAEMAKIRQWLAIALDENRKRLIESGAINADGTVDEEELEEEEEEPQELTEQAEGLIGVLSRGSIPLDKFYLTVAEILTKRGFASVDGDAKLTPVLWKKIKGQDVEGIIGHYVAAFFLR